MACALAAISSAPAAVRINEIVAAPSERLLRWDTNGVARLGTGVSWMEPSFNHSTWPANAGPFGFGTNYAVDLSSSLAGPSFSLYLRAPFIVAASNAAGTNAISLTMDYDSGFVAFLNGREVLRKNMGAAGSVVYWDQPAFNWHKAGTNETWTLGVASNLLVTGTNVFAVQVHSYTNVTFGAGPDLGMIGPTGRVALAAPTGTWRYFAADHEPSGGVPDDLTAPSAIGGREWTLPGFIDESWPQGPGGIGYGDDDDATNVSNQMYGVAGSLYMRRSFVVSPAVAAATNALEFIVNWDDGYIAYLNGAEICRTNMGAAGSFAPHTMLATGGREASAAVTNRFGAARDWLVAGTNVLAIQVHNQSLTSSDLSMIADLVVRGGGLLVRRSDTWRYFVGVTSPVSTGDEDADDDAAEFEGDFADWVELYNDGASPVSLAGWSLTDDDGDPDRWVFPDTAEIGPRQYLLVLCTGHNRRDTNSVVWHTNFKLERGGEYLGLYNGAGAVVSELAPEFPEQSTFHSYGWSAAAGAWRYFPTPTPGATNVGATLAGMCAKPKFVTPAGFYTNSITVTITSATPGATIRCTVDGSEPTETRGFDYAGGFGLSTVATVRARAFAAGWVPSETVTRSFLVNQPALLRRVPALLLAGEWAEAFHKPNGVASIVGGAYSSGLWRSTSPDDYNIPMKRGRPYERPISLEFAYPTNNNVKQANAGLRIAGSNYSRPRYVLQNMTNTWYSDSHNNKPQLNVFFRSDYGTEPFDFKLNPDLLPKTPYESLRLRSGKNDWDRPFIRDEFMRRLYADTGQPSSVGLIAALYVNGIFRCYYNPVERYDTGYLQARHGGTNAWDIISHGGVTEGDTIALNSMMYAVTNKDMTVLSNYVAATEHIDVVNLADYILANAYGATWDWPHNNYYCARERSPAGRFRFYMWDAEGAFGVNFKNITYDILYECITNPTAGARSAQLFRCLHKSPEFRLLVADRIHKHHFNGGGYTRTNIQARFDTLRAEADPAIIHVRNSGITNAHMTTFTNWIAVRPGHLFNHFVTNNVWPATGPALFVTPPGSYTNGTVVELANTNAGGTIYYAFDGADPRAAGGAVAGTAYAGGVGLDRSRHIKARVLSGGGEWSALAEATYSTELPALYITEIMYNPAGTNELEFIELVNAGSDAIELGPVVFAGGIGFDFSLGSVSTLGPGEYVLVVQNLAAFAAAYSTNGMRIAGVYSGKLDNAGEKLELVHGYFGMLQSFDYEDDWYPQTDGEGLSLTLRAIHGDREMWDTKEGWKASSSYGGSPGAADGGTVPEPGAVVINELLAHTDASAVGDWVELHNTTAFDIDVGGWWLSDSKGAPYKYRIPDGTELAGGAYLVLDTTNHFGAAGQSNAFSFSEYGEDVVLSSALDGEGHPTGYREIRAFGASEREVTFGRHERSDGDEVFVAQIAATKGAANAGPRVGPLVMSEILYAPATNGTEYVEVYCLSPTNVPLFDPAAPGNAWRFTGAGEFFFPAGAVATSFSTFVIAGTNAAAFRARYGLAAGYPVYGPFTGRLSNAGERLRLRKPLTFDGTNQPYAVMEEIEYNDKAPWPVLPGAGESLERVRLAAFGNDPANWRAGPVHGTPGPRPMEDSDGDGMPDRWEGGHGLDAGVAQGASADRDGDGSPDVKEYAAGTDPGDADDWFGVDMEPTNGMISVSFLARSATGEGYLDLERRYSLYWAGLLDPTGWVCFGACSNILGADQQVCLTEPPPTNGPVFYRGRAWLQPQ
jgi:hypothetical protein